MLIFQSASGSSEREEHATSMRDHDLDNYEPLDIINRVLA